MTCIVGVQHATGVYIGGDSAGISGWQLTHRADPKVFRVGDFLCGIAGSFRMGNLLRYMFSPPALPTNDADLDHYMVVEFIPALRTCMAEGGYRKRDNDVETLHDGSFLVGVRGRLYDIDEDFQVGQSSTGYNAIGSGSSVALGSLYSTAPATEFAFVPDPQTRLVMALRAAEAHNIGVHAPFVIEKL